MLAQIVHVRGHAAPYLQHLPLYTLRCFAHSLGCPFTYSTFHWRASIVRRGLELSVLNPCTPASTGLSQLLQEKGLEATFNGLERAHASTQAPLTLLFLSPLREPTADSTRPPTLYSAPSALPVRRCLPSTALFRVPTPY